MQHEEIIKRDNGSKVKIIIYLWLTPEDHYWVKVLILQNNKRKWQNISNKDDYEYRKLSTSDRRLYDVALYLQYVSKDEILHAKMNLWNKLKPE